MEVKYRNDLYGNYILIEIPSYVDSAQYSFKMLEKNKISGILHTKVRMEDGKEYWYADISKKRSLLEEYKDKELHLEEMTLLFQQISSVVEELRTYLINETMIVMNPEYMYRDLEDESLSVLVVPWNLKEKSMQKLAEFFLEKMNHKDENGINAAYLFYRQQSQINFSLYQFLSILEKETILKRQKLKETENGGENPCLYNNFCAEEYKEETEKSLFLMDSKKKSEEDKLNKAEKRGSFILLFIVIIVFGIFSLLPGINAFLKISSRAFFLLLIVILVIILIFKSKKNKEELKIDLEQVPIQEIDIGIKETVFFDSCNNEECLKLQWKEKGRRKQYILKDFPCTVGKMKEEVSLCISDISVSRIHCKFIEKEGKIAIMDMNSTNGTFLNGLPVKNGEILEIEKNDEILLGKVKLNVV